MSRVYKLEELYIQASDAAGDYILKRFSGAPLTDRQIALNAFASGFVAGIIWRDKTLGLREWKEDDTKQLFESSSDSGA